MHERIPTEQEFALLIQARIHRRIEQQSAQWAESIILCPHHEIEWIDHHNPFVGYDGSYVEEEEDFRRQREPEEI